MTSETRTEIVVVGGVAAFLAWLWWENRAAGVPAMQPISTAVPDPSTGQTIPLMVAVPGAAGGGYLPGGAANPIHMPQLGGSVFNIAPAGIDINEAPLPGPGASVNIGVGSGCCCAGAGHPQILGSDQQLATWLAHNADISGLQAAINNWE